MPCCYMRSRDGQRYVHLITPNIGNPFEVVLEIKKDERYHASVPTTSRWLKGRLRYDGDESGLPLDTEYNLLQRLSNPHFPHAYEYKHGTVSTTTPDWIRGELMNTTRKIEYILMEHIVGNTIQQIGSCPHQTLSLENIANLFAQAASTTQDIHAAGYVHADIKPDNLIVAPNNLLYVIDLNSAVRIGECSKAYSRSYAAPEQLEHKLIDEKTDVYGLAASLRYLFSHCPPRAWDDEYYQDEKIDSGRVPAEFRNAVERALSPISEQRPTMAEFRRMLGN